MMSPVRRKRPTRPFTALAAAASLLLASSCVGASSYRIIDGEYPGELRAPSALEHDVFCRQYVTASWIDGDGAEDSRSFDAVLQRIGGDLTVVGLDPTGRVGFSIVYDGETIDLTNHMPREFPFDPRFILMDVQRAFYPWIEDGTSDSMVDGERVRERVEGGRLRLRTFERPSAGIGSDEPSGVIRVEYRWQDGDLDLPSETVLDNGWFGYSLRIETLEQKRVEADPSTLDNDWDDEEWSE